MTERGPASPIAIVSTYPPRHCGLASYAADLTAALRLAAPRLRPVVVAVDADGLRYGGDVIAVIDQHDEPSYRRAAARLARAGVRAALVEHEYGIFGGPDGEHVLALADALDKHGIPYVVTLHTVVSRPTPHQLSTARRLCDGAARVTVFSEAARRVAVDSGLAADPKLVVLPHGAPLDRLWAPDPEPLRSELAELDGAAAVLTTFGLISAGKGLDIAIRAMAELVARHPGVRYVIAGRTHPEVARRDGEAHRTELTALVTELRLTEHVRFIDAFLSVEELGALLRRTTVFLTPYRSAEQTSSGALTFALAAGRPVVSSAYQYARDMLATGAGLLVPCGDVAALATAVDRLLTDRPALARAGIVARSTAARLRWTAVAEQAGGLLSAVVADGFAQPRLDLRHLGRLTDDVGIVQFACGRRPDPSSGYCVDDVARLGVVAAQLATLGHAPGLVPCWLTTVLRFLAAARRDGTAMHNLMSRSAGWLDQPHLGDHVGRAIWAAGAIAAVEQLSDGLRDQAAALLDDLAPLALRLPAAGLRSGAYAILGLAAGHRHDVVLATLVDRLDDAWRAPLDSEWCWPEDRLTYDNARLVQALLVGSAALRRPRPAARALASLDWYTTQVGLDAGMLRCVGNRWRARDMPEDRPGEGDEQPIDAAALVEALLTARVLVGDERYTALARRAFAWFLGHNRCGLPLYDQRTGGCHDGLTAHGVNSNEGAESTLAYHQALLALAGAITGGVEPVGGPRAGATAGKERVA